MPLHEDPDRPHPTPLRGEGSARPACIQLDSDLWYDQHRYLLLRPDAILPLTAREVMLLSRLLETPHRFLSAALLAHTLTRPGDFPLDEHGVEQVVSSLRRKLGEPPRHPRLLLNRRGIGYGLFLREAAQEEIAIELTLDASQGSSKNLDKV